MWGQESDEGKARKTYGQDELQEPCGVHAPHVHRTLQGTYLHKGPYIHVSSDEVGDEGVWHPRPNNRCQNHQMSLRRLESE